MEWKKVYKTLSAYNPFRKQKVQELFQPVQTQANTLQPYTIMTSIFQLVQTAPAISSMLETSFSLKESTLIPNGISLETLVKEFSIRLSNLQLTEQIEIEWPYSMLQSMISMDSCNYQLEKKFNNAHWHFQISDKVGKPPLSILQLWIAKLPLLNTELQNGDQY